MKQNIFSRYEYEETATVRDIFSNTKLCFKNEYDERNVQVRGVSAAIANLGDTDHDTVCKKTVILLVYDLESENFLKLKFAGRTDVKINRYYKDIINE